MTKDLDPDQRRVHEALRALQVLKYASSWEAKAFQHSFYMSLFMLVIWLVADGIIWLISGTWHVGGLLWFIAFVFCISYFTDAINSIHQRLDEITDATDEITSIGDSPPQDRKYCQK